jgi:hypothetical protein
MADKHSTERLRILMVRSGGNNILFGLLLLLMNGANPIPVSFYYQQADKHSTEATTVRSMEVCPATTEQKGLHC